MFANANGGAGVDMKDLARRQVPSHRHRHTRDGARGGGERFRGLVGWMLLTVWLWWWIVLGGVGRGDQ